MHAAATANGTVMQTGTAADSLSKMAHHTGDEFS